MAKQGKASQLYQSAFCLISPFLGSVDTFMNLGRRKALYVQPVQPLQITAMPVLQGSLLGTIIIIIIMFYRGILNPVIFFSGKRQKSRRPGKLISPTTEN